MGDEEEIGLCAGKYRAISKRLSGNRGCEIHIYSIFNW